MKKSDACQIAKFLFNTEVMGINCLNLYDSLDSLYERLGIFYMEYLKPLLKNFEFMESMQHNVNSILDDIEILLDALEPYSK